MSDSIDLMIYNTIKSNPIY